MRASVRPSCCPICGFQVVFIGVHLPAYLKDKGIVNPGVAVMALALIGLFNIFGSYYAGKLGGRLPKRYLLSTIYFARAVVISVFLLAPLSPFSVYVFAAAMGVLWLSTVPLTNGIIAGVFGVKHMSMLAGMVFFSHQVGSFLGLNIDAIRRTDGRVGRICPCQRDARVDVGAGLFG